MSTSKTLDVVGQFIASKQEAELEAGRILIDWVENGKRDFSKEDKTKALNLLKKEGTSECCVTLVGILIGLYPWPKGRPKQILERSIIKNFFIEKGVVPPKTKKTDGYDANDPSYGLITECAQHLKEILIMRRGTKGTHDNYRNLISKVLREDDSRKEIEFAIQAKSEGLLAEIFKSYMD